MLLCFAGVHSPFPAAALFYLLLSIFLILTVHHVYNALVPLNSSVDAVPNPSPSLPFLPALHPNRMCSLCFEKCVSRYNDTDLNLGEMSCVDRCVGKYLESHMKVGEVLKNFEETAKQQQQAQGVMPPSG